MPAAFACLLATNTVVAQDSRLSPTPTEWPPRDAAGPNRFGLAYRFGMNIKASFKNVGVPLVTPPDPARSVYNDGYIGVDASGNLGGETMFWGYRRGSQVFGNSVVMSASTPGDIASVGGSDPQHGLELSYNREFGLLGQCPWGLEMAFGYTDLAFRNTSTLMGGPLAVDSYALPPGSFPPPVAPHDNGANAPGPTIYDTPARLPVSIASRLNASLYGLRLGPYLDVPLGSRAFFTLSAGLALAIVQSDYSFQQSFVAPTGGAVVSSAAGSRSELLPGGFIAANLSYRLTKSLSAHVGAQYQNTGTFSQTLADKQAEIDLSQGVFVTAGVGWEF